MARPRESKWRRPHLAGASHLPDSIRELTEAMWLSLLWSVTLPMIHALSTVEMPRRRGRDLQLRLQTPDVAFAGLLLLGATIVFYETRGFNFYFDDWDFVLHRRGLSANVLLSPHGPHLTLIPILVYKLLLNVFGGSSFLPFRFLAAFDVVVIGLVLGLVCRRAWGRWWGLAPVLLLVTLGSGAWSLLWSFQIGYAIADAAGLIALVALSRESRHRNPLACGALVLSLASGSQGIGFLVGAAVMLVLQGDWRRRAWVVLVPAVLYGLWYLKYGQQASETVLSLWRGTLPYTMLSFSSTISGMLGLGSPSSDLPPQLDPSFGEPVALGALAGLAIALRRGWRPPRLFWGTLATVIVLWVAASLSNVGGTRRPTDSRYLPTSAMLALVCVCTALPRPILRSGGAAAAVLGLGVISLTNAGQFTPMRNQMLATDIASRAQTGALLIMRGLVPPSFTPAPPFTTGLVNDVQAGPFFSAYDAFGLSVDSIPQLQRQSEGTRELADQVLARGEELGFAFIAAASTQVTVAPIAIRGHASREGGCLILSGSSVAIRATPGTYVLTAMQNSPLNAAAGRFASTYDISLGVVPAGRTAVVHIPVDLAPRVPWRMLVSGRGRLCA